MPSFVRSTRLSLMLVALAGCAGETAPSAPEPVDVIQSAATAVGSSPEIVPGTMQGTFGTDPHGAANYSIPIAVPPGTAGMQPTLQLQYSSQDAFGIAGHGWNLVGLSMIARCPKTLAQDGAVGAINFDGEDRFCLDGQRLVYVGTGTEYGTTYWEYRTELETFSRIRSYANASTPTPSPQNVKHNPEYWEVRTRAGQTMQYGGPNDSRIEAQGKVDIRAWGLSKVIDAKSNYMTVRYTEDNANGEAYPSEIGYTGNDTVAGQIANNQVVKFVYETRPDISLSFLRGDAVRSSKRLSKVQTFVAGALVREYRLGYVSAGASSRSMLASVQECSPEGTSGRCYAATQFTYQSGAHALAAGANWGGGHGADEQIGDFNGDGVADTVDVRSGAAYVSLSTKSALQPPVVWGTGFGSEKERVKVVDMNADGKSDLIQIDGAGNVLSWRSTGAGFAAPVSAGSGLTTNPVNVHLGDVNGDGLSDAVCHWPDGRISLSYGDGTKFYPAQPWLSGLMDPKAIRYGDFNGDGRIDAAVLGVDTRVYFVTSYPSDSGTIALAGTWATGVPVGTVADNTDFQVGDINGDHKDDLLQLGISGQVRVWLSNGKAFSYVGASGSGVRPTDMTSDVNGDGYIDLVQIDSAQTARVAYGTGGGSFAAYTTWGALPAPGVGAVALSGTTVDCSDQNVASLLQAQCANRGYSHVQPGQGTFTCAPASNPAITVAASPGGELAGVRIANATTLTFIYEYKYQTCTYWGNGTGTTGTCTDNVGYKERHVTFSGTSISGGTQTVYGILDLTISGSTVTFRGLTSSPSGATTLAVTFSGLLGLNYEGYAKGTSYLGQKSGITDVWSSGATLTFKWHATGDGTMTLVPRQYATSVNCVDEQAVRVGDFTGDGHTDVLVLNQSSGVASVFREQAPADLGLLKEVVNGVGHRTNVTYAPLTNTSVYNPSWWTTPSGAAYPTAEVVDGMMLVSRVAESDGIGGTKVTDFRYAHGLMHARGRGFLGFQMVDHVTKTNTNAQSTQRTIYRQDFPYIGSAKETQSWVQDASASPWVLLSKKTSTWQAHSSATMAGVSAAVAGEPTRYFPYEEQTVTSGMDLSGALLPTTTLTNTFSSQWGVLTRSETSTPAYGGSPGLTVTSDNTYLLADTTKWRSDRLSRTSVKKALSGGEVSTRETTFAYRTDGLLDSETTTVASRNRKTQYGYDAWGNKTSVTLTASDVPSPRTITTTYGAQGRFPASITNAVGHTTQTEYDPRHGTATKTTDPNGLVTTATFDGFGRKLSERRPSSVEGTIAYGTATGVPRAVTKTTVTTTGAPTEVTYYDLLGREVRKETQGFAGRAVYEDTEYTAEGRISRKSLPYFAGETAYFGQTNYDATGRPVEIVAPDGSKTTSLYRGLSETISNAKGQVLTRTKDPQGQVVSVADAKGTIRFVYDAQGNRKTVVDPASRETSFAYDDLGFRSEANEPNGGWTRFKNNGFGEVLEEETARQRAAAQKTVMTYDRLGRLVARDEEGETSTWTYDTCANGKGKLCAVTKTKGGVVVYQKNFTYNVLGLPTQESVTFDGTTYTTSTAYDALGRVDTVTYPGGLGALVTKNVYANFGYLQAVQNQATGAVYWRATDANAKGQVIAEGLGNGLFVRRAYNEATGNLESVKAATADPATLASTSPAWIQRMVFGWDALGNVTSREDLQTGFAERFHYDELNRLTLAEVTKYKGVAPTTGAPANLTLSYDASGNILSKSDVGTYTYAAIPAGRTAALPHAVSSAGGVTYAYDANGNMTSGAGRNITWTMFDMPLRIERSTSYAQFTYGPARERVKQQTELETTRYVSRLYETVTKGLVVTHRQTIFAGNEAVAIVNREGSTTLTRYLLDDHVDSIVGITDETGKLVESFSYDAFGKRRMPDGTRLTAVTFSPATEFHRGFTGHEMLDNVGLVHMNGRMQDPNLGRMLSADIVVQAPEMSQSHNRYSYVLNNPLSQVDPSGYFSLKKMFKKIFKVLKVVLRVVAVIAAIVIAVYTMGVAAGYWGTALTLGQSIAYGALGGALLGYGLTGTLRGAFFGAIQGGIAGFIGFKVAAGSFENILAHGMSGGAMNVVQGGDFKSGFLSAACSAFAAPYVSGKLDAIGEEFVRAVVGAGASSVVGGVSAELGGGKFANGARSGAINYLFNELVHRTASQASQRLSSSDSAAHRGEHYIESRPPPEMTEADNFVPSEQWIENRRTALGYGLTMGTVEGMSAVAGVPVVTRVGGAIKWVMENFDGLKTLVEVVWTVVNPSPLPSPPDVTSIPIHEERRDVPRTRQLPPLIGRR